MKVYKIRHKVTGLYSKGGGHPEWTKIGKVWRNKGGLSNHLRLVDDCHKCSRRAPIPHPYQDAEIVEFTATETGTEPLGTRLSMMER